MAVKRNEYIYGSAVREPAVRPNPKRDSVPEQPKKVSQQIRKNRNRALHMNAGYVLFLAVAAVVALGICIHYLQLQSEATSRSENIVSLQEELETLKDANDTHYDAIMDSVNLEDVKARATELGMTSATTEQTVTYSDTSTDYVKQYEEIPKNGTIAKSDDIAEN